MQITEIAATSRLQVLFDEEGKYPYAASPSSLGSSSILRISEIFTSSFWNDVEQIRSNKQRLLADCANNAATQLKGATEKMEDNDAAILKKFDDLTERFDHIYMSKQGRFGYAPSKTVNDAKAYIDQVDRRISQSAVGIKLKKLAHIQPKI